MHIQNKILLNVFHVFYKLFSDKLNNFIKRKPFKLWRLKLKKIKESLYSQIHLYIIKHSVAQCALNRIFNPEAQQQKLKFANKSKK